MNSSARFYYKYLIWLSFKVIYWFSSSLNIINSSSFHRSKCFIYLHLWLKFGRRNKNWCKQKRSPSKYYAIWVFVPFFRFSFLFGFYFLFTFFFFFSFFSFLFFCFFFISIFFYSFLLFIWYSSLIAVHISRFSAQTPNRSHNKKKQIKSWQNR